MGRDLRRGDGTEAAALAIDRPIRWTCHTFVSLSGGRIAVLGNIADEPTDMVFVLPARTLLSGPDAIQHALVAIRANDPTVYRPRDPAGRRPRAGRHLRRAARSVRVLPR